MVELLSDTVVFSWLSGALLLIGLLLGLPAITTALGMIGLERALGNLFWHFLSALDQRKSSSRHLKP